jgi:hypothetical protein
MATTDDHMLDDLRLQAEAMTGPASLPRRDDTEPIFDEPWQGRVVAVAIETVASLGVSWEEFRRRLIDAIDADPHRDYYESWLIALEDLVGSHRLASEQELDDHRMTAASYRTTEQDPEDLEVFPIALGEDTLLELLTDVFTNHWQTIRFGPLIQGAAFELVATRQPRLSMLDGYLTVDVGESHFHLCIGEQRGLSGRAVDPALARRRRCAHAELQRQWSGGAPCTWMFRMFNGDGDQMITILLPHPFLDSDDQVLDEPDWSRLQLWDQLREHYLGLPTDPADRLGNRFVHT